MTANGSAWAKAPEFGDRPDVLARLRAETAADREEYLEGGMRPVECRRCGTCVLVKKNSHKHTSIQWKSDPSRSCAEFISRVGEGGATAFLDSCASLQAGIDDAVQSGRIPVPED